MKLDYTIHCGCVFSIYPRILGMKPNRPLISDKVFFFWVTDSLKKTINGFNSHCLSSIIRDQAKETASGITPERRPYPCNHEAQTPLRWTQLTRGHRAPSTPMTLDEITTLVMNRRAWSRHITYKPPV